jgi:hypothetical protein
MLPYRFPEKTQSSLLIAVDRQQEVDSLSFLVDGTVEVFPLALDFDRRFIHAPALADRALLHVTESSRQLRRELLDPAVDVSMINLDPTLAPHLLQVPIAERIGQIPADAGQDEGFFDAVAFAVNHVGLL